MTPSSTRPSSQVARCGVRHAVALAALACLSTAPRAMEFETSGFATLAVGRTSGPCVTVANLASRYSDECTRVMADFNHAGMYEKKWNFQPESRLGVQGVAKFDSQFSVTTQVMARALNRQHLGLEWLYGEYRITPKWTLQLGRKRLPLYYYSDFQDVGYAYDTVHPSPLFYGWDVVNYNGASLAYTETVNDWAIRTEVLTGRENSRKNPFFRTFLDTEQDVRWSGIGGITAEASHDWFTARLSYVRTKYRQTDVASGAVTDDGKIHHFAGAALNADFGEWVVRTEFGAARRPSLNYRGLFYLATVGYRMGKFTLTGGMSGFHQVSLDGLETVQGDLRRPTVAVRYEVHKNGALKLQLEREQDKTPTPPAKQFGPGNLITASYDIVF